MMKKLLLFVFLIAVGSSLSHAQTCWSEVWSDDFTGTTLNTSNWSYETGTGCPSLCGWGNNEKEYYTSNADNISVSGGNLNITAKYSANYNGSGYNFTSAKIVSRNKQYWKYGKMEARIKMPTGTGVWPAFWMLPQSSPYGGWPTSGEIDIMEYRGDMSTKIDGTLHYGNAYPQNQHDGTPHTLSSGNFTTFHIFAVEWDAAEIRWYVDGTLFKTETKTPNSLSPASNNAVNWPWDQDFYFILNMAVGGWYTGDPTENAITGGNTSWSRTMQVDYVKVYTDLSGGALTGSVFGKTSVLSNEANVVYSIPETAGATYAWTVPSGVTIVSGQNTDSLTVNWGAASGTVSVLKTVSCGNATYSLPVTVMPSACGKMLDDYENVRNINYTFVNGQLNQKIANPASSAENTSPYCAKYDRNAVEQYDVIIIDNHGLGNVDLIKNGFKNMVMDVYSNAAGRNIEITFENSATVSPTNYPTGRHSTYRATTTKANEWETLTFVRIAIPDPSVPGTSADHLVILCQPNSYTNTTYYFDNFMVNEVPPAPAAVTGVATACTNQTGVSYNVTNTGGVTYNWTVPAGATVSSGQGTNAISVAFGSTSGNVSVTQTHNSVGCAGPASTKAVTLNTCTDLHDRESSEMVLYPNPVAESVTVKINQNIRSGNLKAEIFNDAGKLMSEKSFSGAIGDEISISLSDLPPGHYLLRITDGDYSEVKSLFKK